jgi:hypothetical protein
VRHAALVMLASPLVSGVLPASVHESGGRLSYGHEQEDGSWHDWDGIRRHAV